MEQHPPASRERNSFGPRRKEHPLFRRPFFCEGRARPNHANVFGRGWVRILLRACFKGLALILRSRQGRRREGWATRCSPGASPAAPAANSPGDPARGIGTHHGEHKKGRPKAPSLATVLARLIPRLPAARAFPWLRDLRPSPDRRCASIGAPCRGRRSPKASP